MSSAGRIWAAALLAFAIAALPLATCDCREMASRPSQDGHCPSSESAGTVLVAGCACVCMSSAPETIAAVANPWSTAPTAQADSGLSPGRALPPATGPALRPVDLPARSSPRVLRI
jgi:hypothetical protein